MIRGIHHVGMNCRDMERMKKFYCDAFGFEPVDDRLERSRRQAVQAHPRRAEDRVDERGEP